MINNLRREEYAFQEEVSIALKETSLFSELCRKLLESCVNKRILYSDSTEST